MLYQHRPLTEIQKKESLDLYSWDEISEIANSGKAKNYFAIGDMKEIILDGIVGDTEFSNCPISVFIIGFDHNPEIEGYNKIHFKLGIVKYNATTNREVALEQKSGATMPFALNSVNEAVEYRDSYLRKTILGSDVADASSPKENTLLAALPLGLRTALKKTPKSMNVGGHFRNEPDKVANEYLWVLSQKEYLGTENSYEKNYPTLDARYEYYVKAGTSLPTLYIYKKANNGTASSSGTGSIICRTLHGSNLKSYYAGTMWTSQAHSNDPIKLTVGFAV